MALGLLVVFLVVGALLVGRAFAQGNRAARVSALDLAVGRAESADDFAAASAAADEHVAAVEAAYGAHTPALLESLVRAAGLRLVARREGAEDLFARAVAIGERLPPRHAGDLAYALAALATRHAAAGRDDLARQDWTRAVAAWRRAPVRPKAYRRALVHLAELEGAAGQTREAADLLREALAQAVATHDPQARVVASQLVHALVADRAFTEAEALARTEADAAEPHHRGPAAALLAEVHAATGDLPGAESAYRRAIAACLDVDDVADACAHARTLAARLVARGAPDDATQVLYATLDALRGAAMLDAELNPGLVEHLDALAALVPEERATELRAEAARLGRGRRSQGS